MKKHLPNAITLLNMLSGCVAVVFALKGYPHISGLLIFVSAIFDFLDGFFARILNVQSKTGKELDSLSDLISFGLAPAIIIYVLISSVPCETGNNVLHSMLPFLAFLITICSALRLAKFNTDTRNKEVFYGLPTPANAIFIASLPLILLQDSIYPGIAIEPVKSLIMHPLFLLALTVLLSFLLISNIRLLSLKFNSFRWAQNRIQYAFLITSLLFMGVFHYAGIPLICISYFIFSQFIKAQP
jgi:CDP-diacylglycerol---serine O-phosphatidyltransferase